MANIISAFDPSAVTIGNGGSFNVGLINGGWLFLHNESPVIVQINVGLTMGAQLLEPFSARCIHVPLSTDRVRWTNTGSIDALNNAAIHVSINTFYGLAYQPDEWSGGEGFWPLGRTVFQPRVIALPMAEQLFQATRFTLPTDVQAGPDVVTQVLLGGIGFGPQPAGTNAVIYVYGVRCFPESVGSCTISFRLFALTGGVLTASAGTDLQYAISCAGAMGPRTSIDEQFSTPRYINYTFAGGETALIFGYRLVAGYGGMAVTAAVDYSAQIATPSGVTTVQPAGPYGQIFGGNAPSTFY